MRQAILELTPELFVEFAKAAKGDGTRKFTVRANPLPDDAEVIRIIISNTDNLALVLHSESFSDVAEGSVLPTLPSPIFETVYVESFAAMIERKMDEGVSGQGALDLCRELLAELR